MIACRKQPEMFGIWGLQQNINILENILYCSDVEHNPDVMFHHGLKVFVHTAPDQSPTLTAQTSNGLFYTT